MKHDISECHHHRPQLRIMPSDCFRRCNKICLTSNFDQILPRKSFFLQRTCSGLCRFTVLTHHTPWTSTSFRLFKFFATPLSACHVLQLLNRLPALNWVWDEIDRNEAGREDILKELKVDPVEKKLAQYKQKVVKSCQQDGRH